MREEVLESYEQVFDEAVDFQEADVGSSTSDHIYDGLRVVQTDCYSDCFVHGFTETLSHLAG